MVVIVFVIKYACNLCAWSKLDQMHTLFGCTLHSMHNNSSNSSNTSRTTNLLVSCISKLLIVIIMVTICWFFFNYYLLSYYNVVCSMKFYVKCICALFDFTFNISIDICFTSCVSFLMCRTFFFLLLLLLSLFYIKGAHTIQLSAIAINYAFCFDSIRLWQKENDETTIAMKFAIERGQAKCNHQQMKLSSFQTRQNETKFDFMLAFIVCPLPRA